jgi:hypothetical protein
MSEPLASYAFLPWLRRGFAADIARVDGTSGTVPRSSIAVKVRFNSDDALSGSVTLDVLGPGEVKVFDVRTIVRTSPRAGVMDTEPNYFPLVEFDQADLPWRYTPARATSGDRLTPWLMLIVVSDDEVEQIIPSNNGELGRVEIKDAAVLPKHSQLWAWAHAQYSGGSTIDDAKASQLLEQASPLLIARIICPRRLKPRTAYTALLVPSFLRGVLAGLGQNVLDTVDALAPAWADDASGPLTLPFYYQWRFGTGLSGDFESLARLLKKFEAPASVGIRDMDVSAPSPGMSAATEPLGLRGMLEALGTSDKPWPDAERNDWIAALKPLLNLPKERLSTPNARRIVAPPLYGQWPAATDLCAADNLGARPPWFQALSVDPRLRVGAALGTHVIQANQESLMASAWEQVERVQHLNEELRQAQLAREIAMRLHTRHVFVSDAEAVLAMTAPLHSRVKASPTTIRSVLAESPVPRGVFDGAFRRIARPLGPIGRRQGRVADPARTGFFDRLNRGLLSAAPPPPVPSDMAMPDRLGKGLVPSSVTAITIAGRIRVARVLQLLALILLIIMLALGFFGLSLIATLFGAAAVAIGGTAFWLTRNTADMSRRVALRDGTLTGETIRATPAAMNFLPQEAPPIGAPRQLPTTSDSGTPAEPLLVNAFRESAAQLFDRIAAPSIPIREATSVNLSALRTTLAQTLEPRVTFAAAYRNRFELAPYVHWQPDDPIEPIHAAPEFPQPMYLELSKLSPEWLLPGISEVPRNTVTLLKTNQSMVEAFMIGLNHEMARELLWREYPTEQRATYFRQFWDASGAVPQPGQVLDPETLKDIEPIHTWSKSSNLGTHRPHAPPSGGDYLVLLIRGDLLHRYPNTVVYAAKAKWLTNGLRDIDDPDSSDSPAVVQDKQRWPVFSGKFEPDASFFGFALTKEEVRGSSNSGDNRPGFYFVFQEHSSEPRFGLDETDPSTLGQRVVGTNWDNLSWGSLAADSTALDSLVVIDLNVDLPDTTQIQSEVTRKWHADNGRGLTGSRASDLAYITFQRPMRVGIHGEDMVP